LAVTNRAIHTLSEAGTLGLYANLTSGPGFARAIANVITELRLEQVEPDAVAHVAPDLRPLLQAYERELGGTAFPTGPPFSVLRRAQRPILGTNISCWAFRHCCWTCL
jgi:hypothetical protein